MKIFFKTQELCYVNSKPKLKLMLEKPEDEDEETEQSEERGYVVHRVQHHYQLVT